jgi:hypothetical protein
MMDRCVHPDVHNDPSSFPQADGLVKKVAGVVIEVLAKRA